MMVHGYNVIYLANNNVASVGRAVQSTQLKT